MKKNETLITSREYKLMLHANRFSNLDEGAESFWTLFKGLIEDQGGEIVKKQDKELNRRTWYLDTGERSLRNLNYVLRLRKESETPKYKITLKYRDTDRCISGSQDMSLSATMTKNIEDEGGEAEIDYKFEEDILPPFRSKFAHSVSIKTDNCPKFTNTKAVFEIFPGLATLDIPESKIEIVNGCKFYEVVRQFGQVKFGGKPKVKFSHSFWYPSDNKDTQPLVAEFSFDYDIPDPESEDQDRLERFPFNAVNGSNTLFRALQKETSWVHFGGTTKTAFAYDSPPCAQD